MVRSKPKRLSREDWVRGALDVLRRRGVEGIKIVTLADQLGVTSGSFYWHFKDLQELLDYVLEFWERELTDAVIDTAKEFSGPPEKRILNLMLQVIENDAAAYDPAVHVWARNDPKANEVFGRTLKKRFEFARWMFTQAGFTNKQAGIRGRLMVAYLMGESSTDLKANARWKKDIQDKFEVLMQPKGPTST